MQTHLHGAVGIFPFRTHMTEKSMKMGYVEVETQSSCALFPWDQRVRGHVYHFSEILQVIGPVLDTSQSMHCLPYIQSVAQEVRGL